MEGGRAFTAYSLDSSFFVPFVHLSVRVPFVVPFHDDTVVGVHQNPLCTYIFVHVTFDVERLVAFDHR